MHPDDLATVQAETGQLFKKGSHTIEYRFLKKDGTYCWVNDAQQLIRDENGQVVEVVGSWSDITERKQSEKPWPLRRKRTLTKSAKRSPASLTRSRPFPKASHFTTPKTSSSYPIAVIESCLHPTPT